MPQRSYYEIALTNRQVLIAFSILLGCVVSAFISGLWVGRQAAARTVVEADASSGAPAGDTFRFFGEETAPATSELPPAIPPSQASSEALEPEPIPAETAAPEPVQREVSRRAPSDATAQAEPSQGESTPPPPVPTVTPTSPAEARQEEPEESILPPDAEQASVEEPAQRRRVVDPPATSELSVIQVFSTPDEAQARAVLDRLKGGGFRAFLSPVQVDGRTMYRVRVGPFRQRATAEEEAEKLKRLYKLDTWITN